MTCPTRYLPGYSSPLVSLKGLCIGRGEQQQDNRLELFLDFSVKTPTQHCRSSVCLIFRHHPLPPQCKILKHQRPGVRTSQRLVFVMYKKAASFLYYHDLDVYRTQKTCENVKEKKSRTVCLQNKFYSPCRHTTLVLLPKNRCPSITFTCSSLRAKHLRAERYSTSRQNRTRN